MYILYVHVTPNNKKYFGITCKSVDERWRNDGSGYKTQRLFWRAIQKYGWDNIQHIVLADNLSKEWACKLEQDLIWKYKSNNPKYGYNVSTGGEHNSGFHFNHTDAAKKKIAKASAGHVTSKEQRLAISKALKGRKVPKERKLKISKSISAIMTDEYKQNISETVKQRWKEGRYSNRTYNQIPWNKGLTKDDPRIAKSCRKIGEFHHTDKSRKKMSQSHEGIPAHNRKQVQCVETGICYNSVVEAQKLTGINNISIAARNENRTAGKLHWRYIND